jgi:iron(III) transport system substrate-binding protein
VLFYDFMLVEAQAILAKRDLVPTNSAIMPLPAGLTLTFMDPTQMLDQGAKWTALWEKIITKPQ